MGPAAPRERAAKDAQELRAVQGDCPPNFKLPVAFSEALLPFEEQNVLRALQGLIDLHGNRIAACQPRYGFKVARKRRGYDQRAVQGFGLQGQGDHKGH